MLCYSVLERPPADVLLEPLLLKLEVVTMKVHVTEAENIGSLDVLLGVVAKFVYLNKVSLVHSIS